MNLFPLFPLNTVLFPGLPLYLHIFEERYKLMMREVMEGQRTFGVLLIRSGQETNREIAQTYSVGCTARLIRVETMPNGELNLAAIGEERFRVLDFDHQEPYLRGVIEPYPIEISGAPEIVKEATIPFRDLILRYLKQLSEVSSKQDPSSIIKDKDEIQLPEDPFRLLMVANTILRIPLIEKQKLLELSSMEEILESIIRLYQREYSVNNYLLNSNEENAKRSSQLN
jgi:Lon protease-like protein